MAFHGLPLKNNVILGQIDTKWPMSARQMYLPCPVLCNRCATGPLIH